MNMKDTYLKTQESFVIYETIFSSILKDAVTFSIFFLMLRLNYLYLGNSTLIVLFIILSLIIISQGRFRKKIKHCTIDEAINELQKIKENL